MTYSDNPKIFLQYINTKLEHYLCTSVDCIFEYNSFEDSHVMKIYLDDIDMKLIIPLDTDLPTLQSQHTVFDLIMVHIRENYSSLLI